MIDRINIILIRRALLFMGIQCYYKSTIISAVNEYLTNTSGLFKVLTSKPSFYPKRFA